MIDFLLCVAVVWSMSYIQGVALSKVLIGVDEDLR